MTQPACHHCGRQFALVKVRRSQQPPSNHGKHFCRCTDVLTREGLKKSHFKIRLQKLTVEQQQRAVSNVFTLCLKMKKCCFNNNLCIYLSICLSLAAAHASHQRVSHEEKPEAHRPERHDPGATAGHSQRPALPN